MFEQSELLFRAPCIVANWTVVHSKGDLRHPISILFNADEVDNSFIITGMFKNMS